MRHPGTRSSRSGWLIALRTVIISSLLLFTALVQLRGVRQFGAPQLYGLYGTAGAGYILTLVYALLQRWHGERSSFAAVQLLVDNLLISLIVIFTGGVDSFFPILYFLTVIGAAMFFWRRGTIVITAQAAVVYLAAVFLPFFGRWVQWLDLDGRYLFMPVATVVYRATLTVAALATVAILTSYLSESLRRAGEALSARESDLARLTSLNENIVQSIASGLITTDLAGTIVSFNRAAEKITRRRSTDGRGVPFSAIFSLPGGKDPFSFPWGPADVGWRCEGGLKDLPGVVLGMTFSPLRDDRERIRGVICSFQDLTEIRKMEEQLRRSDRLAAIGEMAAGVAHEIRNPLASISGSIQLLREELPVDADTKGLMDIVNRETERLNSIITDFLQFANPRQPSPEETDVTALAEETLAMLRRSLPPGAAFRLKVEGRRGERVRIDPQLVRQAAWNLSLNAVQAMPRGGDLVVRVFRESTEGGLVMEFDDTGEGIAESDLPRVFSPFFSTKENGTGLGLAIVFKIVEQHGGSVEIDSVPGRGTTFRLKFPPGGAAGAAGEVS